MLACLACKCGIKKKKASSLKLWIRAAISSAYATQRSADVLFFFSVASWREDLQRPPSFTPGLKCLSGLINGDAAWHEAAGGLKKQTLALPIRSDLLDAQADLINTRPAASRTLWYWQREAGCYRQSPPHPPLATATWTREFCWISPLWNGEMNVTWFQSEQQKHTGL